MTILEAILLGVIQGLTEFFPVSSSGHLVMGQAALGIELPGIVFDVAVHVATLLSVTVVYRRKLLALVRGMFVRGEGSSWNYILLLVLATIPAAIVGLSLEDYFEARFDDAVFAATMILVTGTLVWSSRWALATHRVGWLDFLPVPITAAVSFYAGTAIPFLAVLATQAAVMAIARKSSPSKEISPEPRLGDAVMMGIAQSVAILPGISRSGSTVIAGLWRRLDPLAAAEFSFLMSIPAIFGAAILQVPDVIETGFTVPIGVLVAGFLAAAISGVLAIRFFVVLLRRQNFFVFAYYCWAAATLFLLLNGR